MEDKVHKAAPGSDARHCVICGAAIKRVPGGQGPTWVHADSGAVAAPNPPGAPASTRATVAESVHASDCATNNGPALTPGPCNCGVADRERRDAWLEAEANDVASWHRRGAFV